MGFFAYPRKKVKQAKNPITEQRFDPSQNLTP